MKLDRSPRKRPQQSRSLDTVNVIIEAAVHILLEHDFDSVTTKMIARRAGVSIGSLYQYFPNKLAVLEALRERHLTQLWEAIGAACDEACTLPWPGALRHVVAAAAHHNRVHAPLIRLIVRELPVQFQNDGAIMIPKAKLQHRLTRLFESHRASLKVSSEKTAFMMPALGRGVFVAVAVDRPQALEGDELIDEVMTVLQGYLGEDSH